MTDETALDAGQTALELADEAIDFAAELNVAATRTDSGATVVDLGIDARGSLDAGLLFSSVRRGGLVAAEVTVDALDGHVWPTVEATTGHPDLVCELTQTDEVDEWLISGPGLHGHHEPFAVVTAIGDAVPDDAGAGAIASAIGVSPDALYVVVARPGSMAWGVDAAMAGLDVTVDIVREDTTITAAVAAIPVPPTDVDGDRSTELADVCRQLGGRVHLRVDDAPEAIDAASLPVATLTLAGADGTVETVGSVDDGDLTDLLAP